MSNDNVLVTCLKVDIYGKKESDTDIRKNFTKISEIPRHEYAT